jgi:hypothetical protein
MLMVSVAGGEELVAAVVTEHGFGGREKKLRIIAAPFLFFNFE